MKDVTVVIKTFLRDYVLYEYIKSIYAKYPDINIAVVDDGHITKEKINWMKEYGVEYMIVPWDSGLPAGRNMAIEAAKTPYVIIGDDDFFYGDEVDLEKMRLLLDKADIVGGAVRNKGTIGHYEGNIKIEDRVITYEKMEQNNWKEYKGARYKECELVFNFAMMRKDLLNTVRWDENIKIVFEHSDYFLMCKESGVKVVYTPDSIVEHRHVPMERNEEYANYRLRRSDKEYFFKKWGVDKVLGMNGSVLTL
jgi:GT2 family glycosyltransferase